MDTSNSQPEKHDHVPDHTEELAAFATSRYRITPTLTLLLATLTGLMLMNTSILLGLHLLISCILLIVGILLVFASLGGKVSFTVRNTELEQVITPFFAQFGYIKPLRRTISWEEITALRRGMLGTDSRKAVSFIQLTLKTPPYSLIIRNTDQSPAFPDFCQKLQEQLERHQPKK